MREIISGFSQFIKIRDYGKEIKVCKSCLARVSVSSSPPMHRAHCHAMEENNCIYAPQFHAENYSPSNNFSHPIGISFYIKHLEESFAF